MASRRTAPNGREAFWPTEDQEALLRAALLPGPDAVAAWQSWKSRNHLVDSHLDRGSFRLLPLVYKNLVANGAEDRLMTRLKGVYRFWWCANQQLFHDAAALLEGFHAAGIRTMVLKGAALSTLYYRDAGIRPMSDVDVLVPYHQATHAIECLVQMAWRLSTRALDQDLRFRHAAQLQNDKGREFDLHWHVFSECLQPDADDDLWRRAVTTQILSVRTHALGATDSMLHTIVHGIHWNPVPTIRWIPDSMAILRSAGAQIDWDLALEQAVRRRLLLRFRTGLCYLRDAFDAPIPDDVIRRLNACRPSYGERIEYSYITLGPEERSQIFLGYYPYILLGYLRFAAGHSPLQKVTELPEYLRYRLSLSTRTEVLWTVLRDAVRKTRKLLVPRLLTNGRP